jgi:catechol 2,3-dioxygenase-like lactoylglutathione lyase family enzyme
MATLLHLSFRVKDPARSAALYAALLGGRVVDIGPPLDAIGVKGVYFGRSAENELADQIELWPDGKHWSPDGFTEINPRGAPFGHFAVESDKSSEELAAIAQAHGATLRHEPRGVPYLVPVVYDHDGNFVELFRPRG